jgi:hypothetical protein
MSFTARTHAHTHTHRARGYVTEKDEAKVKKNMTREL